NGLALDAFDALLDGPELSAPAARERPPAHDCEPIRGAVPGRTRVRGLLGTVPALIVDENDRKGSRIVLAEQRTDARINDVGLVPCRDHGRHGGPDPGRGPRHALPRCPIVALTRQPKAASCQEQVDPGRQTESGNAGEKHLRSGSNVEPAT